MPQTLAEANDILVELAWLEKDMVAFAGLRGEQLTAPQAQMSSNLKCIVGCIYAKELITAISEAFFRAPTCKCDSKQITSSASCSQVKMIGRLIQRQ